MLKIRTDITNYAKDSRLDMSVVEGAMDVSFENIGLTAVTIKTIGGSKTIAPGDPMLTWGGYPGYYRTDVINIIFATGKGRLIVYINKHVNFKDC